MYYSETEVKKLQQMTSAWTACFYIQVKFSTWISGHKICILFNSSLFCHHYLQRLSQGIISESLRRMKLIFDGLDLLFCGFWSFILHQISFLMIKFEFFSREKKLELQMLLCLLKLKPKNSMLTKAMHFSKVSPCTLHLPITFRLNLNKDPKGPHMHE